MFGQLWPITIILQTTRQGSISLNGKSIANCYFSQFVLTCSRRAYYFFFGPPCGIIFSENSEKISRH